MTEKNKDILAIVIIIIVVVLMVIGFGSIYLQIKKMEKQDALHQVPGVS